MEGNGEEQACKGADDQTKDVRVVLLIVRKEDGISLDGRDTVGVGHLEPNGEDHDEEGGGEDQPAAQACRLLLGNPDLVDEPVEEEANDEGDGRGDEDAVENLVDAAPVERVCVARVHPVKASLKKLPVDLGD